MITVGIPTFKRPELLNVALASLIPSSSRIDQLLVAVTGDLEDSVNRNTMCLLKALDMGGVQSKIVSNFSGLMNAKQWFVEQARGDIILFMDDDAVLGNRYFDLVDHFNNRQVAAVSGSLITPINDKGYQEWDDREREFKGNFANVIEYDSVNNLLGLERKYQVYLHRFPRVFTCEFLVGTALFVRKSCTRIDLEYQKGHGGEEIDFTYAMFKDGRTLIFDSERVAWHLAGTSGGYCERPEYRPLDFSYFGRKWGFGKVDGLRINTYKEKP